MLTVAVMYPGADGATFDHDYYLAAHIPLVRRLWEPMGLTEVRLLRGAEGPDGTAPTYVMVALLTFRDADSFTAAAGKHGREIFKDIPNFTNAQPVMQYNQPVTA